VECLTAGIGYYKNIAAESREFERRSAPSCAASRFFMNSLPLLNPVQHGPFAWQLLVTSLPVAVMVSLGAATAISSSSPAVRDTLSFFCCNVCSIQLG
jgi:hypothetical protein